MSIPFRMNTVSVKIQYLAKEGRLPLQDKPIVDQTFKRPRGSKIFGPTPSVEIKAQVVFDRQEDRIRTEVGDGPKTLAHLTVRKENYDALDLPILKGDLIVEIAGEIVKYEVEEIRRAGFLNGRANLVMIFFDYPHEDQGSP